jgi:uncharacterized membrane protein YdjX (TVP38/TMEM64 family)
LSVRGSRTFTLAPDLVMTDTGRAPSTRRLALLGAMAAAGLAAVLFLPLDRILADFLREVEEMGLLGPVLLALAWVPSALLFLPGSVLSLGAGFVFGLPLGVVTVSAGSVLGACAAFLAGRTLARHWVERKVAGSVRFQALAEAVKRNGLRVVLLTRLSPLFPFNLLNYALGVTRVRFRDYLLGSWVGMLPGTVFYVYLGSAARSIADVLAGRVDAGPWRMATFVIGLAATAAVALLLARAARRALREEAPPSSGAGSTDAPAGDGIGKATRSKA